MRTLKSFRNIFLTSTLALPSLLGCGREEPASPETLGASAQAACSSLVPVMTSPTTPSGIVTRSGAFGTAYEAWQAFDAAGTMWLSAENQTPAWIAYEFGDAARTVHRYALHFNNGASLTSRAPMQWTFEGWNGTAWVVLDTRTNQTGWLSTERREFALASPATYRKYRLHITDDNDSRTGIVVASLNRLELLACAPDPIVTTPALWTRTAGIPGEITRVQDTTGDAAGRTYVTGRTIGGLEGNAPVGDMDAFLIARDANGARLWARQMGVPGQLTLGYATAVSPTGGDVFVGGFTSGSLDGAPRMGSRDAFLSKYSSAGVWQWTRQLGGVSGTDAEGYGAAVDGAGNAFLVGYTNANLDGHVRAGRYDAFVVKYDAAGNKQWTRQFGVTGLTTMGRRAATDSAGNVYVSGWAEGGLDGNVKMGNQDLYIIKFDGAGNKLWTRQLGSNNNGVWLYGSDTDAAGNIYVTGYSGRGLDGNPNPTSGIDAFLTKYDAAGNKQWTRELGATGGGTWATGVVANANGVYLSGSSSGDVGNLPNTLAAVTHNYVAKYDAAGNRQWVMQQAPAARPASLAEPEVRNNGLSIDATGNFYLGGYTSGHFDGNTLVGREDLFVTKLPAR